MEKQNSAIEYKYNEDALIRELMRYVDDTYKEHYATGKLQATEVIMDAGMGEGFLLGNIIKYVKRYGHKDGKNRKDLFKVLHYSLIMLYFHDRENPAPEPEWTPVPGEDNKWRIKLAKAFFGVRDD